ncbi:putative Ig domain-containing protein [Rhodanobacter sp. UC4437_H4]
MSRRIILVDIGAGLTLAGVLPSVALLADYSAQLKARGGQAPYTYTVTTGAAELTAAGLQLDPATGILSGTASVPGTIAITVRATDLSGAYVERGFTVPVIAEPLSLSGAAPMWTVGTPYSYAYTAAHGVPPYTWSIASGSLPAGLTLSATGEISGTPTAGNAPAWTVRVTDSAGTSIDLRDNATLQLLGDFADAAAGTAYSSDLLINGGDEPYSNPRVTVGALPAGLALSIVGDKLRLSGTATTADTTSFTVAVDSGDGQTAVSAQIIKTNDGAGDEHWSNVVALLHFDTDFTDQTGKVWTAGGPSSQITATESKFGGKSCNFNGTPNWSAITDNTVDFAFPGDFTIEMWVWQDSASTDQYRNLFLGETVGCISVYLKSGKLGMGAQSIADDLVSTNAIPTNEWVHLAVTRSGNLVRVFVNGVLDGMSTVGRNYIQGTNKFRLGSGPSGSAFAGYLDDFRITKGIARYTSNFTPPAAAFPDHG